MKITILSVGTRGDIQPLIALGKELKKNGAQILFSTHSEYKNLVTDNGLEFHEMPRNPIDVIDEVKNNKKARISLWQQMEPDANAWLDKGLKICSNSDAIIFNYLFTVGQHLGEYLKIPFFSVFFEPNISTKEFPIAYFPIQRNLGAWFNKFTYLLGSQLFWRQIRHGLNKFRKEKLSLEPIDWKGPIKKLIKDKNTILYCFSSALVSKPNDWGNHIHITGYWYINMNDTYIPPNNLVNYLNSGSKPIFFDFGSFANDKSREKVEIILKDIKDSGNRLIIAPGKINLDNFSFPDNTFILNNEVPHEWILPKLKAIISHGGVGVVHAALKAGIPTIPISIFAAQFYWGYRLNRFGFATKPLRLASLKQGNVLEALKYIELNEEELSNNLENVKKHIANEAGVEKAASIVLSDIS